MTIKTLRRMLGGLLAVLVAGCGLSDYEQRMRDTQKRVERFTEEAGLLENAEVAIPTKRVVTVKEVPVDPKTSKGPGADSKTGKAGGSDQKTAKGPGADSKTGKAGGSDQAATKTVTQEQKVPVINYPFYFRVPHGIRPTPDQEPRGELAYRYPRVGAAPVSTPVKPSTASTVPKPGAVPDVSVVPGATGFIDVFLAFGNDPANIFADKVLKAFPHIEPAMMLSPRDVVVPERRDPLHFEVREFNDSSGTAWSVYVHTEPNPSAFMTVAVIYRMEKAKKASLDRAVEMSLASLALGNEADAVRQSYARRPR